ncbi:hypothetical protein [Methyloglobulus sp.]
MTGNARDKASMMGFVMADASRRIYLQLYRLEVFSADRACI